MRSRKLTGKARKRISKKRMFIKRGGGVEDDILRKVDILRQRDGDFDDQELKKLTGAELLTKMRSLRNASDGSVSLGDAAKFGKDLMSARRISAYNDEVIKELLAAYDMNSIKELIFSLDPVQLNLQEFLPRHMVQSFGGDLSNWLFQKISSNVFLPSSKPKITKRDLPMIISIIQNKLQKYPEIDVSNENTQQLIIKDLLKKIYYLNELNKLENQTMSGGSLDGVSIGVAVNICILTCYLCIPTWKYLNKLEKEAKERDLIRKRIRAERGSRKEPYHRDFNDWWEGTKDRPYTGWFGHDSEELNDFIDENVDKYLQREPQLQNEYDDDIRLMQQGIKPTSKTYLKSDKLWNKEQTKWWKDPYYRRADITYTKLPEKQTALFNKGYRDAFIDSKVDEYLALEPALLRNTHDAETSREVFNTFRN